MGYLWRKFRRSSLARDSQFDERIVVFTLKYLSSARC